MLTIFPIVFFTVFMAEMGDKTQLLLVAMAGKYKIRDVLAGTWLATVILNLLAVTLGAFLSKWLDMRLVKSLAAIAFFYFSWATVNDICCGDDEEEKVRDSKGMLDIAAVFITFFIGELGDKTQLSAITLAAAYTENSIMNAFYVFAGATLALIAADFLGFLAGMYLKNKIPTKILNIISLLIFAFFGILNAYQAGNAIFENQLFKICFICGLTGIYAGMCCVTLFSSHLRESAE